MAQGPLVKGFRIMHTLRSICRLAGHPRTGNTEPFDDSKVFKESNDPLLNVRSSVVCAPRRDKLEQAYQAHQAHSRILAQSAQPGPPARPKVRTLKPAATCHPLGPLPARVNTGNAILRGLSGLLALATHSSGCNMPPCSCGAP